MTRLGRFSRLFIEHPRKAVVAAVLLVVAGVLALACLPLRTYPTLSPMQVSVSCSYPGANAREVMNTVAGPIENQVNGVEDMLFMNSSCADNGEYVLTVTFELGVDKDVATMKVQNLVQQALGFLPQEVKNAGLTVKFGANEHLAMITLRSPDGRLNEQEIIDYANGIVLPAVQRISGIGRAWATRVKVAMRIWLDTARLSALGLTAEDVVAAIQQQNVQASLGAVGAEPAAEAGGRSVSLIAQGRLHTPAEFDELIVRTTADGGLVRLKDVGRIELGYQSYGTITRFNNEPAVKILAVQLPGCDLKETKRRLESEMRELEKRFPEGLAWEMSYDVTRFMEATFARLAILGIVLLAVLLATVSCALRSWRAAPVFLLALVLSLLPTFAVLAVTGQSLNVLGLFAAVLSCVVVILDTAIVVGKIRRAVECDGLRPQGAAIRAMDTLATPLAVSMLLFVVAFVPFGFVNGLNGVIYRPFATVLAAAAVFSTFNALSTVPAFATAILAGVRHGNGVAVPFGFFRLPERVRILCLLLMAVVAAAIFRRLPTTLIPDEDSGVIYIDCNMPEGTQMQDTMGVCDEVVRRVLGIPGVRAALTDVGSSEIGGTGENQALIQVILDAWSARRDPSLGIASVTERINAALTDIPNARLSAYADPSLQGFSSLNGVTMFILSTADADPVALAKESHRIERILAQSPMFDLVANGYQSDTPHLRVNVDRAKCELMQVPLASLYSTLQYNLGSIYVNDINLGTQVNRVTVAADWSGRATQESVKGLYARASTGAMIPVGSLVSLEEEIGPRVCYRYNQYVCCSLFIVPRDGVPTGEAIAEVQDIVERNLAAGYAYDWGGKTFHERRSKGNLLVLAFLSALLVYLVLAGFYESFAKPLVAVLPVASVACGAAMALWLTKEPVTIFVQVSVFAVAMTSLKLPLVAGADGSDCRRSVQDALAALFAFALGMLPFVLSAGISQNSFRSLGISAIGSAFGVLAFELIGNRSRQGS